MDNSFEICISEIYTNYIFIENNVCICGWIGYEGLILDDGNNIEIIGVDEL